MRKTKWRRMLEKDFKGMSCRAAVRRLPAVHFNINERDEYARRFDEVTVNGKIGYIVEGMDCDCTQYRREGTMDRPTSLFAFLRQVEEDRSWLDGPQSVYYVRPSDVREGYNVSRDLAMEAHEDGHDHVVYMRDLS